MLFIKIFILFIIIDMIWIKFLAENKYKKMIKDIQNEELKIKILPTIFVYIFMTLLLILFRNTSNINIFLLGFLTYGVYDMTNYALFNKFNLHFAILYPTDKNIKVKGVLTAEVFKHLKKSIFFLKILIFRAWSNL